MRLQRLRGRGSVSILTGLIAIPLIAIIGLSIDVARIWLVTARLQTSLDAAVLVAARDLATGGNSTDAINLFWADFDRRSNTSTTGYLSAAATTPVVHNPAPGGPNGSVQLTSTATVAPAILGVMGIGTVTVSAASTAQGAATGLELAMVLDVTGSMAGSSITSLRTAANNLLNIVYGGADTQPHLWVSIVPFAATINIGAQRTDWLVSGSLDQSKYSPRTWMGCAMARTAKTGAQDGDDFNDRTPAQAPFEPFFYASTYHQYSAKSGGQTYYYKGDNDWRTSDIREPATGDGDYGPNLGCPTPAQQLLPPTRSHATVKAVVDSLSATYRGGTFINLGLQAGWWMLSPTWQSVWNITDDLFDPHAALPLPYNTRYMKKAIVLMTDGNNNWNDWTGGVPGAGPTPSNAPQWVDDGDADFTAYGRLLTNTRGLSVTDPTTTLNTWMSQMCTTIKQNGIVIYTILFNNNTAATQTLFRNCASSAENYFLSPTGADLQSAFRQIGQDLSVLRISQ